VQLSVSSVVNFYVVDYSILLMVKTCAKCIEESLFRNKLLLYWLFLSLIPE